MPAFVFGKILSLCVLFALVAIFSIAAETVSAAEPAGPSAPVRLEVVNGTNASHLRCQLVFAHFVTLEFAPVFAGNNIVIRLRRDMDDGTLIYQRSGGRRMAVENILCGITGNWQATRNDLNMTALRQGQRADLRFLCEAPKALSCKIKGVVE